MAFVACCSSPELDLVTINNWYFYTNNYVTANERMQHEDSVFVCIKRSGPSDYHAEWRYYPLENKYKLLVSSFESMNVMQGNTHIVHEVDAIGDVIMYCSQNLHPLNMFGVPIADDGKCNDVPSIA